MHPKEMPRGAFLRDLRLLSSLGRRAFALEGCRECVVVAGWHFALGGSQHCRRRTMVVLALPFTVLSTACRCHTLLIVQIAIFISVSRSL